ncbi:MAG: class I SAM-dependent methyltransferase [Algicola sp.]|nr:class I SAM-dependent methyltransferase [Algicola sp.]
MTDFTELKLETQNLDVYYIRHSIFSAIKKVSEKFEGTLLDVGCGKMPYKDYLMTNSDISEYIGLDIENAIEYDSHIKPDFTWDGVTMPFEKNSYNCAMATEVLEHCPKPELILKEINRVLKPEGILFFTVPFLWNLHEVPNDQYRYTPFALKRHLIASGFKDVEIKATGGWHASMGQMLGLWVRRSPMSQRKRKLLSQLLKPVISFLIRRDNSENVNFKEGQMITGLYGYAKK